MFDYIHNIEGRLRLRATSLKANGAPARKLQIDLRRIPGVRSVEINLLTGSVLIQHDGKAATTDAIAKGLTPFAQAALSASMLNPSQASIASKATRAATSWLVEAALERLPMASLAVLL
jgi:copper chaperone CopZ